MLTRFSYLSIVRPSTGNQLFPLTNLPPFVPLIAVYLLFPAKGVFLLSRGLLTCLAYDDSGSRRIDVYVFYLEEYS